jgi:hypothetical protein
MPKTKVVFLLNFYFHANVRSSLCAEALTSMFCFGADTLRTAFKFPQIYPDGKDIKKPIREPPTFTLFSKLPFELRQIIWTLALPKPRTIMVTSREFVTYNERMSPVRNYRAGHNSQTVPCVLHVCAESRSLGLKDIPTGICNPTQRLTSVFQLSKRHPLHERQLRSGIRLRWLQ